MSKRKLTVLSVLCVATSVVVLGAWGIGAIDRSITEQFVILEAKRPYTYGAFLTEAEALAIARQALDAAGYPSTQWLPLADGRTKAPDGRPDEYFVRNTEQNGGWILFRNEAREDWYRDLHVGLHQEGVTLEVAVSRGK